MNHSPTAPEGSGRPGPAAPPTGRRRAWWEAWAPAVATLAVFLAFLVQPNHYYKLGDPRGALLTAQAVLEHGTLDLGGYPAEDFRTFRHQVREQGDRRFYAYPYGSGLLALPVVAGARALGLDLRHPVDDILVQALLAALTAAAAFRLLLALARPTLGEGGAWAFAGVGLFGSPLASTCGVAWWSFNGAVLAVLGALVLLGRADARLSRSNGAALGGLLFLAFFCRPTALLWAPFLLWEAARRNRSAGLWAAFSLALPAAGYLLFNRLNLGHWFGAHYADQGWVGNPTYWMIAGYGHLLGPSRGILIFCPYLAVALAVLAWPRTRRGETAAEGRLPLPVRSTLLLSLTYLTLLSAWNMWWGGHGFGPRILTDSVPAWLLLVLAAAARLRVAPAGAGRTTLTALAALTAAWAVWLHTARGVWEPATAAWNAAPNVDIHWTRVLDWSDPQWLARPAPAPGQPDSSPDPAGEGEPPAR